MSDINWQTWQPSRDGEAPQGVTLETHEIEYKLSTGKYRPHHPFSNIAWYDTQIYRYRPRSTPAALDSNDYATLRTVLNTAYDQAARGKGVERHGNGKAWTEQPIFTIAGQVGDGFNAGQAIKKIQEAQQMAARGEYAKAQHEVLGAIVYAASLHVLWNKESNRDSQ